MILVETSIWIDDVRGYVKVNDLVRWEDVLICPVILQEVLQGADKPKAYDVLRASLFRLRMVDAPTPLERFEQAAQLFLRCRKRGYNFKSGNDCLIAASAIAHNVPVLARDGDFEVIAEVSTLKLITPDPY